MLLLLGQRRHHRLDRCHQFPQPVIERNQRGERKSHRRLPRALADEPQQHAVGRDAGRHGHSIQPVDIAHQIAAQREHGLDPLQALVLACGLFEIHLGAQPVARRRRDTDQRGAIAGQELLHALPLRSDILRGSPPAGTAAGTGSSRHKCNRDAAGSAPDSPGSGGSEINPGTGLQTARPRRAIGTARNGCARLALRRELTCVRGNSFARISFT